MRSDIGEWPADDLPEGWTWSDFGDFFEDVTSSTKKLPTNKYQSSGKFRVIDQSSGLQSGWTDDDTLVHPCPPPVVTFGDHTRFVRLVNHPFVQGADGMKVFRPRFDSLFAFYAMLTIELPDKGYSRHFSYLRASRFPIPPLPEQRRIVAKLDELRARSRKAREALDEVPALLDKLKQSVLAAAFRGDLTAEWRAAQPVGSVEPASVLLDRIRAERRKQFAKAYPKKTYTEPEPVDTEGLPDLPEGWAWAPFEELTPSDAAIVYGIIQPGPHIPDGVPFVRPADIKDSKVVFSDLPRTSPEIAEDYRRAALQPGDVVFSIVGTIGKWIIAGEELRGANITQSSVRLRPARPLTPWFFVYVLAAPVLTSQINKLLFGNAVQRLNVDHVRKLVVPVPPTAEWSVIEAKVSAALEVVGRLNAAAGSTGSELNSLDQSILAKAFRGELVPQDPNDEPADVLLARIKAGAGDADGGSRKGGRGRKAKGASA